MEKLFHLLESARPLSHEVKQYLQSIIKILHLAKKDFLLKWDDIFKDICFVKSGLFRCYYNKGYKKVCFWFMKEGGLVISIKSFYQQKKSYEFIQALKYCLYRIFRTVPYLLKLYQIQFCCPIIDPKALSIMGQSTICVTTC